MRRVLDVGRMLAKNACIDPSPWEDLESRFPSMIPFRVQGPLWYPILQHEYSRETEALKPPDVKPSTWVWGLEFRVWVWGLEFRVWVWGLGFRVWGLELRI